MYRKQEQDKVVTL